MATMDNMTAEIRGARVLVTGTVDGTLYRLKFWRSDFAAATTKAQRVAIVAAALKAKAAVVAPDSTFDLSGAVTV